MTQISSSDTTMPQALAETLEGRLPVLPAQRLYAGFGSFMWTCSSLAAASWVYLIGSSLPSLGNTWLSIGGYTLGNFIGLTLVSLASGVPSFRYGVDTIDASKSALGVRGSLVFLVTVLVSCIGWANVLIALTARSAGTLASTLQTGGGVGPINEVIVVGAALLLVGIGWWLSCKGPAMVSGLSRWCVPGQMVLAVVLAGLLVAKYGVHQLLHTNVAPEKAVTQDHLTQLALAIEFGVNNALVMLPFFGGLTRLVKRRRHLVGPLVVGCGVIGALFLSGVAGLSASASGTSDPLVWINVIAGPWIGSIILLFMLVANIGALVTLVYLAAISIQQIGPLARLPWKVTVALVMAPSLIVSFKTQPMLDHVMQLLTYNGVMFVGLTAVLLVDFFLLSGQAIAPSHLFTTSRHGRYWYSGGVNWVAMAVVVAATALYLWMYNPITLEVGEGFRYLGAGVPTIALAATVYWLAMSIKRKLTRSTNRQVDPSARVELRM
jgi:nucleobase:cation symporter-1, NCS1 family